MAEIILKKRYPHISDEDVTEIFQNGYLKGWENARKNAIPMEWIREHYSWLTMANEMIKDWEKENEITDEEICRIIETDDYYNHQEEIDRQMADIVGEKENVR